MESRRRTKRPSACCWESWRCARTTCLSWRDLCGMMWRRTGHSTLSRTEQRWGGGNLRTWLLPAPTQAPPPVVTPPPPPTPPPLPRSATRSSARAPATMIILPTRKLSQCLAVDTRDQAPLGGRGHQLPVSVQVWTWTMTRLWMRLLQTGVAGNTGVRQIIITSLQCVNQVQQSSLTSHQPEQSLLTRVHQSLRCSSLQTKTWIS